MDFVALLQIMLLLVGMAGSVYMIVKNRPKLGQDGLYNFNSDIQMVSWMSKRKCLPNIDKVNTGRQAFIYFGHAVYVVVLLLGIASMYFYSGIIQRTMGVEPNLMIHSIGLIASIMVSHFGSEIHSANMDNCIDAYYKHRRSRIEAPMFVALAFASLFMFSWETFTNIKGIGFKASDFAEELVGGAEAMRLPGVEVHYNEWDEKIQVYNHKIDSLNQLYDWILDVPEKYRSRWGTLTTTGAAKRDNWLSLIHKLEGEKLKSENLRDEVFKTKKSTAEDNQTRFESVSMTSWTSGAIIAVLLLIFLLAMLIHRQTFVNIVTDYLERHPGYAKQNGFHFEMSSTASLNQPRHKPVQSSQQPKNPVQPGNSSGNTP